MQHLLYSSNEMYSSTDLIRKSKTIFNKIISNEIDKAIIMRDGKPSFMLLEFDKYEKIMLEYDILKAKELANSNASNITTKKKKKKNKQKPIEQEKVIIEQIPKVEEIITQKPKIVSSRVVPPVPEYVEKEIENIHDEIIVEEEIHNKEQTAEDEVQQGLEVLDNLDFDDEFKQEVERKVRERKEREIAIQKEKAEKEAANNIEEVVPKKEKRVYKEPELKEFWA
ncbi:MAG: hypothetical protein DRG78_11065 [Epsilonproteobacteria bacterium]|nr:MAG: hypothetical protein DRG78_11065 [Campylobacterota bacterium]